MSSEDEEAVRERNSRKRKSRNVIVDSEDESMDQDDNDTLASSSSRRKPKKIHGELTKEDSGVNLESGGESSSSQESLEEDESDSQEEDDEDYEDEGSSSSGHEEDDEAWEDVNGFEGVTGVVGADPSEEGSGVESDQSDGQSEKCPICLNRFRGQDMGTPESCDHVFCLECIQEWAKKVNTCPVDRQIFNLILVRKEWGGKIVHRIPLQEERAAGADEEEDELTYCEVCGQCDREDRLLLCDACDLGYHCECLEPPLQQIPVEEWFCPDCDPLRNPANAEVMEEVQELLQNNFRPNARGVAGGGGRVIARTRASEMVRSRIERRRLAEVQSDEEGDDNQAAPERARVFFGGRGGGSSTTPRRRRAPVKRRRRRRRKRKVGTGTKSKTVSAKKKSPGLSGSSAKPKRRRRKTTTRRKKGRRTARSWRTSRPLAPAASVKKRIADKLGLRKPLPGQTIPRIKSTMARGGVGGTATATSCSVGSSSRARYGASASDSATSFSIFGDRNELPQFDEHGYEDDSFETGVSGGVGLVSRVAHQSLRSGPGSLKKAAAIFNSKKNLIGTTSTRLPISFPAVSSSLPTDILGSILEKQTLLHSNPKSIVVQKDGSLSQKDSTKQDLSKIKKIPLDPNNGSSSSTSTNPSTKSPPQSGNAKGNSGPAQESNTSSAIQHQRSYSIDSDWSASLSSSRQENNDNYVGSTTPDGGGSGSHCHNNNNESKKKAKAKENAAKTKDQSDDDIDIYSDIETISNEDENDEIHQMFPIVKANSDHLTARHHHLSLHHSHHQPHLEQPHLDHRTGAGAVSDSSDDELVIDEGEAPQEEEKINSFELESISDPDFPSGDNSGGGKASSSEDAGEQDEGNSNLDVDGDAADGEEETSQSALQPSEENLCARIEEENSKNPLDQVSEEEEEDRSSCYDASQEDDDDDGETEAIGALEQEEQEEPEEPEAELPEQDTKEQEVTEAPPADDFEEEMEFEDDEEEAVAADTVQDDDVISARVESPISEAEEQGEEEFYETEDQDPEEVKETQEDENQQDDDRKTKPVISPTEENETNHDDPKEPLDHEEETDLKDGETKVSELESVENNTSHLENSFSRLMNDGVEDISDEVSEENALDYSEDMDVSAPVPVPPIADTINPSENVEAPNIDENEELNEWDESADEDERRDDDDDFDDDRLVEDLQEIGEEDIKLVKSDVEDLEDGEMESEKPSAECNVSQVETVQETNAEQSKSPIETTAIEDKSPFVSLTTPDSPPSQQKTQKSSTCPKKKNRSSSDSRSKRTEHSSSRNKRDEASSNWKKPSKSSRERSYRDGKPRDERLLFRQRELKENEDEKTATQNSKRSNRDSDNKKRNHGRITVEETKKDRTKESQKSRRDTSRETRERSPSENRGRGGLLEKARDRSSERKREDDRHEERKKDEKRCRKDKHRSCEKREHSSSKGVPSEKKERHNKSSRRNRETEKLSSNRDKSSSSKHPSANNASSSGSRSVSSKRIVTSGPTDTYFDYFKFGERPDQDDEDLHYMYDDPDLLMPSQSSLEKQNKDRNVRKIDDKIIVEKRGKNNSKKDKQERKLRDEVYQSIQPALGGESNSQPSPQLSDIESKEIISKDGSIIINVNYNRNKEPVKKAPPPPVAVDPTNMASNTISNTRGQRAVTPPEASPQADQEIVDWGEDNEIRDPQSPQSTGFQEETVSPNLQKTNSEPPIVPVRPSSPPPLSNHVKRSRTSNAHESQNQVRKSKQQPEPNKRRVGNPPEPSAAATPVSGRKVKRPQRMSRLGTGNSGKRRSRPEVITISESEEESPSPKSGHHPLGTTALPSGNIPNNQDRSNSSSSSSSNSSVSQGNSDHRVPDASLALMEQQKVKSNNVPRSPPSDSLNFSGMFNKRHPRSPSPPSPMENESYDPCDPTRSPGSPESPTDLSETVKKTGPNTDLSHKQQADPKPPPSPELPPLPPEPEPQQPLPSPSKIFSPLPVLQTQPQAFTQPTQYLPPTVAAPPALTSSTNPMVQQQQQHFLTQRLPSQGSLPIVSTGLQGLQSLQSLQGLQWSLSGGPTTMLFPAGANQMQHFLGHQLTRLPHQQLSGLMASHGANGALSMLHPLRHHMAGSPLLPTPSMVGHPNNVGQILHRQMTMPDITQPPPPILSGIHQQMRMAPEGSVPTMLVSSVPLVPVTVMSQQQPQQQLISSSGQLQDPILVGKVNDASDVVDMEVDSPYSPADSNDGGGGDALDDPISSPDSYRGPSKNSPSSFRNNNNNAQPPPKDAFDALLAAVPKLLEDKRTRDLLVAGAAKVSKLSRNRNSPKRAQQGNVAEGATSKNAKGLGKQFGESRTKHKKKHHGGSGAKKEVAVKMNDTQLKIIDDLPSSAVEMQVKEKFLKKLNRQERVVEEVKLSLKPFYNKRDIGKEDYKSILRKCVPKICHNKTGEINPVKIKAMVDTYVRKYRHNKKKSQKGNNFES